MLMLIFIMGILFISSIQPMMMISSLILIILMYSYMIYNVVGSYWFSYVLMLIMLSGVLVLFTYMITLLPNESFESYNLVYIFMLTGMVGIFLYFYKLNMDYMSLYLWKSYFGMFNMFMVSFLLGIMLIVVWLSYMGYGAVRVLLSAWMKD